MSQIASVVKRCQNYRPRQQAVLFGRLNLRFCSTSSINSKIKLLNGYKQAQRHINNRIYPPAIVLYPTDRYMNPYALPSKVHPADTGESSTNWKIPNSGRIPKFEVPGSNRN